MQATTFQECSTHYFTKCSTGKTSKYIQERYSFEDLRKLERLHHLILNVRAARKNSVMLPIYVQQIEQIYFVDVVVLDQP
jgi:hypothetical protein